MIAPPICHRHAGTRHSIKWLVALLIAVPAMSLPSKAQDPGWNPFAEEDARPRLKRAPTPVDPRPVLPPMDGRFPTTADAAPPVDSRPTEPGDVAPYSPPGTYATTPYTPSGVPGTTAPGAYAPAPPAGSSVGAAQPTVQRGELPPVVSSDGRLPAGAWRGLDAAAAERLIAATPQPIRSPVLHDLWRRMMTEPSPEPRLRAPRTAALYRAGLFADALKIVRKEAGLATTQPEAALLLARLEIMTGDWKSGCGRARKTAATTKGVSKNLKGEAIVLAGYCAVKNGRREGAGLAAELARDMGYRKPFTIALLDSIASGGLPRVTLPAQVSSIDGMLAGMIRASDARRGSEFASAITERASPGLLAFAASDVERPTVERLQAAERAARINAILPSTLADAYRSASGTGGQHKRAEALERADHFTTVERAQAQFARTRAVRSLLDSARRADLYFAAAEAIAPAVARIQPTQEIGWFAETAVEVLAAGGAYARARTWINFAATARTGQPPLDHWRALLDIADPNLPPQERGRSLAWLEEIAQRSRMSGEMLHRLATVLDALNYNVPIPLWNMASRTPQPKGGHLPATGVLAELADAAKNRQIARTTLYALRTIGPSLAREAHILALGDTIRALKRAGLEREARRLGFEALFASWPRTSGS